MLALERVAVRYSGRPVLRDVSFSIGPGEIVAYLGANGAGKTTTMKVVTGLREPDHGRVLSASVGLLLVVWRWLVRLRERQAGSSALVFDDAAHPHLTLLGLEWRIEPSCPTRRS